MWINKKGLPKKQTFFVVYGTIDTWEIGLLMYRNLISNLTSILRGGWSSLLILGYKGKRLIRVNWRNFFRSWQLIRWKEAFLNFFFIKMLQPTNILTPKQVLFLELFNKSPFVHAFYLSGGTALCGFYIPYRYSELWISSLRFIKTPDCVIIWICIW